MAPVSINDTVTLDGHLRCLIGEDIYVRLNPDDMEINITGCLAHEVDSGGESVGYDTWNLKL